MGNKPNNNSISLKDRLIQSSKTNHNKPNDTTPNSDPSTNTVDNMTNELSASSQHPNNHIVSKTIDTNKFNYEANNNTNHIQNVPNTNSTSNHNINIETDKNAFGT